MRWPMGSRAARLKPRTNRNIHSENRLGLGRATSKE
jgi:hypothetical protein